MTDLAIRSWALDARAQGLSPATISNYERDLKRFSEHLARPLETATVLDCREHVAARLDVSDHAAYGTWRALRSLYRHLLTEGIRDDDPTLRLKAPRVQQRPQSIATEEDIQALLGAVTPDFVGARDRAFIALLWSTGMRRTEAARLLVDDVDVEQGVVTIRQAKTGKGRVAFLDPRAQRLVMLYLVRRRKHRLADKPNLWLGRSSVATSDGLRQAVYELAKRAGVDVSSHSFRRGFAVDWLSNGGSQTSLQSIAGWNSGAMVSRYVGHAAARVAEAEFRRLRSA